MGRLFASCCWRFEFYWSQKCFLALLGKDHVANIRFQWQHAKRRIQKGLLRRPCTQVPQKRRENIDLLKYLHPKFPSFILLPCGIPTVSMPCFLKEYYNYCLKSTFIMYCPPTHPTHPWSNDLQLCFLECRSVHTASIRIPKEGWALTGTSQLKEDLDKPDQTLPNRFEKKSNSCAPERASKVQIEWTGKA